MESEAESWHQSLAKREVKKEEMQGLGAGYARVSGPPSPHLLEVARGGQMINPQDTLIHYVPTVQIKMKCLGVGQRHWIVGKAFALYLASPGSIPGIPMIPARSAECHQV